MSQRLRNVSARAWLGAGTGLVLCAGAALAQTQLSLQETGLSVTANHSGNQVVYLHLDSLGAHAAVYGIVGRPNGSGLRAPGGAVRPMPPTPAIVRSTRAVDWSAPHEPDELIVCYDQQWVGGLRQARPALAMRQQKDALHSRLGATLQKELRLINADVIQVPHGADLQAAAERYARQPGVTWVQPNYIYEAIALPNDPNFPFVPSSLPPPQDQLLWGLHTTAQNGVTIPSGALFDMDIDAAEAWEVTTGSSDVIVAVIDTGVEYTHADLVANMWTNPGELAGNGLDDDGNGFVDDIHGYDFKNNDGDPFDDHYHGTHVAGTIGAVANNAVNVAGVNWNVRIMALKFLGADGKGTTAAAIDSVDYAVQMGAMISNNSWGGFGFDAGLYAAIHNAGAAGHLFLAAAGNNTADTDVYRFYPATYNVDEIISVAALNKTGQLAWFSNYGATSTDLGAPGEDIYSLQLGGGITSLSGTSMATPHVAGVAALLKAMRPDAGPLQIKQWLLDGTTPHAALAGKTLSGGRLNAVEPLRLATMPWLRIASREGIIAAGGSATIPVTFVTENVPVGTYSGSLVVLDLSYDNAVTPRIEIPVNMNLEFVELAPIVEDVHQFVVRDVATPVTLIGHDPNIGQSVDFTIATLPVRGTLTDPATSLPITAVPYTLANGANTVTYMPAAGQIYSETFQYTATDGTNTSAPGTVTIEVLTPPRAPEDVSTYSGTIFVDINWLPNVEPDIAGYHVYVSPTAGGPYLQVTAAPYADTTYRHYPSRAVPTYYVVTAVRESGAEGGYSAEVWGQPTFPVARYTPMNLRATPSYERVYLEWEPPVEFNGVYRVIRSLEDGSNMEIIAELTTKSETSFIDEGYGQYGGAPQNGVTYKYYVENWEEWESWGADSNLITVTPAESTWPSMPTGLAAVGGIGYVDVTWNANPELDIDEYWVLRAPAVNGPFDYVGSVRDRRFYDTDVEPDTTYYYMITAVDLDGEEGDWTEPVSATTGVDTTPPAAPTNLIATPGDGVVHLDWNDNTEPDLSVYYIYRATTSGGPYEEVDNDTPSLFSIYGLTNGTTYYFVVTAMDFAGNQSVYSNEASATPAVPGTCTGDAQCADGVYCNGVETCVAGLCQPGTAINCTDGVACTTDSCNEATDSCDHTPNPGACNNGLYCDGVETCHVTLGCQAGTAINCDDSVACTQDVCNESTDSCTHTPNNGACDNGLYCDGAETCHVTLGCQAGTAVNCADAVVCTLDSCNESTDACDHTPDNTACDNGVFCDGAETCHATLGCQAGADPCDPLLCRESDDQCVECLSAADCDDGLFCNGAESCDGAGDCQPGTDPCPGQTCNEGTDTCTGGAEVWVSFIDSAAVPAVGTVENEDIVARNVNTGAWSLIFDGSDVGLSGFTIDGLARLSDGSILLSFTDAGSVAGMTGGPSGTTLDDSDIVRFIPTSLGATTTGSFVFYFDGSDVGLTTNNEDIDAIGLTASGQLVVSTVGAVAATGASGADTDLLLFNATSLGSVTTGTFSVYFDGSDVSLTDNGSEDVDAVAIRSTGALLLSTLGNVSVPGVAGANEDILQFTPTQLGATTSGSYLMYLDLSTLGIATGEDVGGVEYKE